MKKRKKLKQIELDMKFNPALMKFEPDLEKLSVKKRKINKENRIKICPKCRSKNIKELTESSAVNLLYHYSSPRIYRCSKCGFTNPIFPEIEEKKLKKMQKELSKNSIRDIQIS